MPSLGPQQGQEEGGDEETPCLDLSCQPLSGGM